MAKRLSRFLSAALHVRLWIAIVAAIAICVGSFVLGENEAFPRDTYEVLNTFGFALGAVYFSVRIYRYYRGREIPLRLPLAVVFGGLGVLIVFDLLMGARAAFPGELVALLFFWFWAIVVYFPARIYRNCRAGEMSMRETLGAVAAFHALALAEFFWGPSIIDIGRSLVAELIGLDFWILAAIFLATWGVICVLIALRFERLGRFDATRTQAACTIGICAALLLIALGAQVLIPGFPPLYASFGADLPRPTALSFAAYQYWYAIPLLGAILAGCVLVVSSARVRRAAFDLQIGLLVASNLAMVAVLSVMFLPMAKTCGHHFWDYAETGFTRLHAAALLGRTESVVRLIAGGEPADGRNVRGITPLRTAIWEGHLETARTLLARGADVNAFDNYGGTPLQDAVGSRPGSYSLELVSLLLEHGAKVNAAKHSGDTALHAAAWHARADVATLLLAKGADVNAMAVGGTPLDIADLARHLQLADLLLQHGAVRATKAEKEARKRIVTEQEKEARERSAQARTVSSGSCG